MPVVSTAKMTASQYAQLGEDPVGVRLELVDGQIAITPSCTPEHSLCLNDLAAILSEHVQAVASGIILTNLDTKLDDYNVRRPDVLYFSQSRLHLVERQALRGPPDLCVEIVSPSSATIDHADKFGQYLAAGVRHYWIVDPTACTFEGFEAQRGRYVSSGGGRDEDSIQLPPFPELEIPLSRLWWQSRRIKGPSRRRSRFRP